MAEITKGDIEKLKEVFGPLSKVNIDGVSFILRTLNRKDLATLKLFDEAEMTPEKEEAVVALSLLWPRDIDFDNMSAGTITSISEVVLDKSGILGIESLQKALDKARNSRTVFNDIYEIICCAFPSVLPGDLDLLTIDRLMEILVMSENILIMQGILEQGIEFNSTNDEEDEPRDSDATAAMLQNALEEAQQQGFI